MFKAITVLSALTVLLLSACSSTSPSAAPGQSADLQTSVLSAGKTLLSPAEVQSLLQNTDPARPLQVLDVRTPQEFQSGCLEGAREIDLNSGDFESSLSTLDKNATYLVYCRSGRRSADAVQRMKNLGFGDIVELEGGISAWQAQGLAIKNNCS
jgi:rhodanese-related sulfurtransferase